MSQRDKMEPALNVPKEKIMKITDTASIIFLIIAIVILEIGYRKGKSKIFIIGLEFLAIAIFTLLIKHLPKVLGYTIPEYIQIGIYSTIAYCILKLAVQYTMKKQKELKDLSDIKEIVKEEPTKKATKRKNIK